MRRLCCACHSTSIAALIYIIVVPDMHGQKVAARQSPSHRDRRVASALEPSLWRRSKFKHFNTAVEQVWFPGAHADIGEDKTAGGIIIPDTAKEKPSQGEITAVGPGGRDESGKLIPIDLKVGDRVLFGKMVRHRGQARRSGAADHEGERHHGRSHRSARCKEEGRVSAGQFSLS
jgi:hypothetical protein